MRSFVAGSAVALVVTLGAACGGDEGGTGPPRGASGGGGSAGSGAAGSGAGGTGGAGANSSGGEGASNGGTGGNAGGSGSGGSGGSTACNSVPGAPPIAQCFVIGQPPTPQGGPIAPGLYYLTALTTYMASGNPGCSSASGPLLFETWNLGTTSWDDFDNLEYPVEQHQSGTYTASGTTMTVSIDCPYIANFNYPYSVTSNKLLIFWAGMSSIMEFTKQ